MVFILLMLLFFWGDIDGSCYCDSYFDMYLGQWCYGDWIKIILCGGVIIYGWLDVMINCYGICMGMVELYCVVEDLFEVFDSFVVDFEFFGCELFMLLFVVLCDGVMFDDMLCSMINVCIKVGLLVWYVFNVVVQVFGVLCMFLGKKMEVLIKKLLFGVLVECIVNLDVMVNLDVLVWYVSYVGLLFQ